MLTLLQQAAKVGLGIQIEAGNEELQEQQELSGIPPSPPPQIPF